MTFVIPRPLTVSLALGVAGAGCSSGPAGDAPIGTDSGTRDSQNSGGPDASLVRDGAPADASSCLPADVSNLKVAWKHATKFYQGLCTPMEVETFRKSCLAGDTTGCAKVPMECAKCIASDEAAEYYGALIVHHGWVELNIPGCVANAMGDPNGVKCAGAMQAARMCELAACGANCPVSNDATLGLLDSCTQAADQGQCKSFATDAECANRLPDASPDVDACFSGTTFAASYTAIAGLFCLPNPTPPPDAGAGG